MNICSEKCEKYDTLASCIVDCCCRWCNSTIRGFCADMGFNSCPGTMMECTHNNKLIIIFLIFAITLVVFGLIGICIYKRYVANRHGYTSIRDNL